MIFISVTRLRLRSVLFLPLFSFYTFRSLRQVRRSSGFLDGGLLPDHDQTFWTMTAWKTEAHMRAYMISGGHKAAMPKLMHWCDEASVVHWLQESSELPTWTAATARMRAEGRPSKVKRPSPSHAALTFREPRLTRGGRISRHQD